MGIKGIKKEVWKGIAAIGISLFVILCLAAPVAESYSGRINAALGISTTQVISSSSSE